MKFKSKIIALIFTTLVLQAGAQPSNPKVKYLNKSTIDLTYGSINAGAGSPNGWPAKFGFIWNTTIAGSDQQFKVDFNTLGIFIGSKPDVGWGIDCTTGNHCKKDPNNKLDVNMNKVQCKLQGISAPFTFGKSGSCNETYAFLVESGNPYDNVGVAGLGLGSFFWIYLRKVGLHPVPLSIQFSIQGQKNLSDNMVSNEADTKNLNATLTLASDPPKDPINVIRLRSEMNAYSSYGIIGATVTLPYTPPRFGPKPIPPAKNIVTLINTSNKICIAPDLPYVFVAGLDQATIDYIQDTYTATVCPGAKSSSDLKTMCTEVTKAPTITIKINKQKLILNATDWVYLTQNGGIDTAKTAIKTQLANPPQGVFAVGAPCEGATFALGRNFFTKYGLTIQSQDAKALVFQISFFLSWSPGGGGGGSGWPLSVWIGIIALVFIVIGTLTFCAVRIGKKRSGSDGGYSDSLNA